MTIKELLKLPTESLEAMSDEDLAKELAPLIPECRAAVVDTDNMQELLERAKKMLAQ